MKEAIDTTHALSTNAAVQIQAMKDSVELVYMMGASFLIGSLFTILVLILLDFMKRDRVPNEPD